MREYDAVIAGYTCVDLLPEFKKNETFSSIPDLFKPGKLIEIGGMDFVLGGLVPNTGLAMKKFDKKVFLNGLIGNDFIGEIAKTRLNKYGVSEGIKTTDEAGTAFSIVIAPPGIDRIFLESPGCNQIFDSSHIDFEAVSRSGLFHFGYPPLLRQFFLNSGDQLSQMYSKVHNMGVITSLDFSLPDPESESGKVNWPEIMQKTLPFVDIFVPSIEEVLQIIMPQKYAEIQSLSENDDFVDKVPTDLVREVGKKIIDAGVKILLIKMGSRGAYLLTGDISYLNNSDLPLRQKEWNNREIWCNAYKADESKIINASGAGDTAVAAFLSAILDGESPELAVKYANVAGRDNLYCDDIYNDMSNWQKLSEEMKSELNELFLF